MLATRGSFCARRPGLSLNNLCFVFVNYGTKINLINGWKPSTLRDSWQGRSKKKKKKKVLMKTIKKLKKREKTITCVHDVWAIRNRSESLTRRRDCFLRNTVRAHIAIDRHLKKKKKGKKQNLNDRNRDRINNKNNKSSAKNYYYNNCKSNNNNNSNNQWVI